MMIVPVALCLTVFAGACTTTAGIEQAAAQEPVSPLASAAPMPAPEPRPVPRQRDRVAAAVGSEVTLNLQYTSRVLVPRGADLNIAVRDQTGATVRTITEKTGTDAPPYPVKLRIPASAKYPLQVTANLASPIGHKFGTTFELSQEAVASRAPMPVTMQMQR